VSWFVRRVRALDVIPFPFGIAYRMDSMDVAMCYWVPLNLVVRYAREFWYWMAVPRKFTMSEDNAIMKRVIEELREERDNLRQVNQQLWERGGEATQKAEAYDRMMAKLAELEGKLGRKDQHR